MFVKICGITNRDDALAAVDAGARALGFIFYSKSPRHTSARELESWVGDIPAGVWKVGIFVDEEQSVIEQIALQLQLDIAQLHGAETPEQHPRNLRIWRAFRKNADLEYPAEAILLDSSELRTHFCRTEAPSPGRIIIAGGLNAENVREAIDNTHPWGVDVASGVESSPGRKDHARMKLFIKAALSS